jgi:hypothetical protein
MLHSSMVWGDIGPVLPAAAIASASCTARSVRASSPAVRACRRTELRIRTVHTAGHDHRIQARQQRTERVIDHQLVSRTATRRDRQCHLPGEHARRQQIEEHLQQAAVRCAVHRRAHRDDLRIRNGRERLVDGRRARATEQGISRQLRQIHEQRPRARPGEHSRRPVEQLARSRVP